MRNRYYIQTLGGAAQRGNPLYVYHLTYRDNLPGIAARGLVPRMDVDEVWGNEPGLYFVSKFGYEAGPGADSEYSAWLRFPAPPGLPHDFWSASNEAHTMQTIPAGQIDVLVQQDDPSQMAMHEEYGRWMPLLSFAKSRRVSRRR